MLRYIVKNGIGLRSVIIVNNASSSTTTATFVPSTTTSSSSSSSSSPFYKSSQYNTYRYYSTDVAAESTTGKEGENNQSSEQQEQQTPQEETTVATEPQDQQVTLQNAEEHFQLLQQQRNQLIQNLIFEIPTVNNFITTTEIMGKVFPDATDETRPKSIEELVIPFSEYDKAPKIATLPYYRFTEQRDGYNVETFLKKIGRGCDAHIEVFPTWEDLMNTNGKFLKEKQVPVRNRRWILHWVEQWKQGRNPVLISKSKSIANRNTKKN
ncbi:hypothetical protein DFA_00935 [Cavenderia fasciculata]|uniref:Small ribosomal subunit protein mS41 n=1 Tax=Cavenderia fasciculata TaxID=261658 RepID=F4PUP3_CACFS|nr:uncharacterized protein DFA_00935 [Cavenderia fasciculata]EGG21062.1 hypothetical protein DFA_00935 [Cavenderia fasciculata]|eukprot:XP_004358912.1 hypothetical protein DFA_00935 [Cavenderia fasciculata]